MFTFSMFGWYAISSIWGTFDETLIHLTLSKKSEN